MCSRREPHPLQGTTRNGHPEIQPQLWYSTARDTIYQELATFCCVGIVRHRCSITPQNIHPKVQWAVQRGAQSLTYSPFSSAGEGGLFSTTFHDMAVYKKNECALGGESMNSSQPKTAGNTRGRYIYRDLQTHQGDSSQQGKPRPNKTQHGKTNGGWDRHSIYPQVVRLCSPGVLYPPDSFVYPAPV